MEVSEISVNLHEYILTANRIGNDGGDNGNLEIYNGTVVSSFEFAPNCQNHNIWIHNLIINATDRLIAIGSGQCFGGGNYLIENTVFNLDSGKTWFFGQGSDVTFKNVNVNCATADCYDFSSYGLSYGDFRFENVKMTGISRSISTDTAYASVIDVINTTLASMNPNDYSAVGNPENDARGEVLWRFWEEASLSAKDQTSTDISAVADINAINQNGRNPFINKNPVGRIAVGIPEGKGSVMLVKNMTFFGLSKIDSNFQSYNVTVKSRGKSQSKIVIFSSPASESFALDFTSEDTGTNVVIDQRTIPEKTGNAITGLISFLSPLAMIFAPLLMLI
jgi:hypothetical protein